MKSSIIIFFLLFLTSCAWHGLQENLAQKEAERFQNEFLFRAATEGFSLKERIKVNFVNIKEKFPDSQKWAGVCALGQVFIDQGWWVRSTVFQKEQLMFHELGHCVLGLTHGKGIMGEKEIPSHLYTKHKELLLTQLFKQARKQRHVQSSSKKK